MVISKRYESIYLTGLPFCMYKDRKILFNCQRDYTPPAIKGLRKDKWKTIQTRKVKKTVLKAL